MIQLLLKNAFLIFLTNLPLSFWTKDKVRVVKLAEATAESLYLQGLGTSRERSAIAKGIEDTVLEHCDGSKGNTPDNKTIIDILLVSQYYDILSAIGRSFSNQILLELDAVDR